MLRNDSMLSKDEIDELERVVDATSLSRVVEALAAICAMKAEHVRVTWQDEQLARTWERAGNMCDQFSQRAALLLAGG